MKEEQSELPACQEICHWKFSVSFMEISHKYDKVVVTEKISEDTN